MSDQEHSTITVRFTHADGQEHPEQLMIALEGICASINQANLGPESNDLERVSGLAIAAATISRELVHRFGA